MEAEIEINFEKCVIVEEGINYMEFNTMKSICEFNPIPVIKDSININTDISSVLVEGGQIRKLMNYKTKEGEYVWDLLEGIGFNTYETIIALDKEMNHVIASILHKNKIIYIARYNVQISSEQKDIISVVSSTNKIKSIEDMQCPKDCCTSKIKYIN